MHFVYYTVARTRERAVGENERGEQQHAEGRKEEGREDIVWRKSVCMRVCVLCVRRGSEGRFRGGDLDIYFYGLRCYRWRRLCITRGGLSTRSVCGLHEKATRGLCVWAL